MRLLDALKDRFAPKTADTRSKPQPQLAPLDPITQYEFDFRDSIRA